ncbi:MAG: hypothetical protein ACYS7Y_27335 [Planctomycetota bacterium]|jgi:hypothetical protein
MTITAKHPVRAAFSDWSTGNDRGCYYSTKGHAVNAFDGALQEFDFCLDRDDLADFTGNEGRKTIEIHDEFKHCVGRALITWYRMPSGRYEFVGYIT